MKFLYAGESSKGNLFFRTKLNWWSCSKETWEKHQNEIKVVGDARDGIFEDVPNIFHNGDVLLTAMSFEKAKDSNIYIHYIPNFYDVSGLAIFNDRIVGIVNKNPACITIPQEIYEDIKNLIEKEVKIPEIITSDKFERIKDFCKGIPLEKAVNLIVETFNCNVLEGITKSYVLESLNNEEVVIHYSGIQPKMYSPDLFIDLSSATTTLQAVLNAYDLNFSIVIKQLDFDGYTMNAFIKANIKENKKRSNKE